MTARCQLQSTVALRRHKYQLDINFRCAYGSCSKSKFDHSGANRLLSKLINEIFKITLKKRTECRKFKDFKIQIYYLHFWKQKTVNITKNKARHWTRSWAIPPSLSVPQRSTTVLSYHLLLCLPSGNFQRRFPYHFPRSLSETHVQLFIASYIYISLP
jgi:hypothetical protein